MTATRIVFYTAVMVKPKKQTNLIHSRTMDRMTAPLF